MANATPAMSNISTFAPGTQRVLLDVAIEDAAEDHARTHHLAETSPTGVWWRACPSIQAQSSHQMILPFRSRWRNA